MSRSDATIFHGPPPGTVINARKPMMFSPQFVTIEPRNLMRASRHARSEAACRRERGRRARFPPVIAASNRSVKLKVIPLAYDSEPNLRCLGD